MKLIALITLAMLSVGCNFYWRDEVTVTLTNGSVYVCGRIRGEMSNLVCFRNDQTAILISWDTVAGLRTRGAK